MCVLCMAIHSLHPPLYVIRPLLVDYVEINNVKQSGTLITNFCRSSQGLLLLVLRFLPHDVCAVLSNLGYI